MEENHRLNSHDRALILNAFLNHTFKEDKETLIGLESRLSQLARVEALNRNISLGGKIFKEIDFIDMLPDNYISKESYIWINAGGYSLQLTFDGKSYYDRTVDSLSLKMPPGFRREQKQYIVKDRNLISEMHSLVHRKEKLDETTKKLRTKMQRFLSSIRTVKKLFETMPELKEILGEKWSTPTPATTALVVTAAEILCEVANIRGEKREGCCNGEVISL